MPTDAQLAANRRNALRSTGPTTAEGKEASRGNALRHGLRADTLVLLPSEDAGEFAAFAAGMQRSLAPADECEEALVRRIVLVSWRLERLCRIEADLLAGEANLVAHDAGIAEPPLGVWPEEMAGLARYEAMLDRALERAMKLLEKRQGARRRRGLAEEESTERTQLPEPAAAPAPDSAERSQFPEPPDEDEEELPSPLDIIQRREAERLERVRLIQERCRPRQP